MVVIENTCMESFIRIIAYCENFPVQTTLTICKSDFEKGGLPFIETWGWNWAQNEISIRADAAMAMPLWFTGW